MKGNDFDSFYGGGGYEPIIPPMPPSDPAGRSAQKCGVIGLILALTCCSPHGIVLGILALMRASTSRRALGFETAHASTGRLLGTLSIVFSAIRIVSSIATVILVICGMLLGLDAGAGAVGGTVI